MNKVLLKALLELSRSLLLDKGVNDNTKQAAEQLSVICNVLVIGEGG